MLLIVKMRSLRCIGINSTVRKIGPKKPPVMKLINNCHQKEEWGFFIFLEIYVTHNEDNRNQIGISKSSPRAEAVDFARCDTCAKAVVDVDHGHTGRATV